MAKPLLNSEQPFVQTESESSQTPGINEVMAMDPKMETSSYSEQTEPNVRQMEVGPGGDFKMPCTSPPNSKSKSGRSSEQIDSYRSSSNSAMSEHKPRPDKETERQKIDLDLVLKEVGNDLKTGCLQWTNVFQESGDFEKFCPTRVDKLLAEAKALEENLTHQKEQLMDRLKALSRTLQTI
ncbi:hypothetical protein HOLleu_35202 [Holothuria leucospilota]|uniref:Uncharacterized protein n=1 Tax=Holothuria leucospilota TaxID=206669 RepID=A0A9Q0YMA4_HOLLE|nr:hypothetical protein HOLleu_35202 [Holothuria leucospilota]